jgi:hypothetical protein
VARLDGFAHIVEIDLFFRYQMKSAPRLCGLERDPSSVATHNLGHKHAMVRLGGRMQPVDAFSRYIQSSIEPERVIGRGKVVIYRLGNAYDVGNSVLEQFRRDPRVSSRLWLPGRITPFSEVFLDLLHAAFLFVRIGRLVPEYRAAFGQNTGNGIDGQRESIILDHAFHPLRIPTTSKPSFMALRTTALITGFKPGQSPRP